MSLQSIQVSTASDLATSNGLTLMAANTISPVRGEIEGFVKQGFARAHDAKVQHFLPVLLALQTDQIQAAVGIRGGQSQLYIEQYFDRPMQSVLASKGLFANNDRIAEIGNLHSRSHKHTLSILMASALALCMAGYQYVLFTGTERVVALLRAQGVPLTYLCDANPVRLSEAELAQWGNYYQTQPKVMALSLVDSMVAMFSDPKLQSMIAVFAPQLKSIWQQVRCL